MRRSSVAWRGAWFLSGAVFDQRADRSFGVQDLRVAGIYAACGRCAPLSGCCAGAVYGNAGHVSDFQIDLKPPEQSGEEVASDLDKLAKAFLETSYVCVGTTYVCVDTSYICVDSIAWALPMFALARSWKKRGGKRRGAISPKRGKRC